MTSQARALPVFVKEINLQMKIIGNRGTVVSHNTCAYSICDISYIVNLSLIVIGI